ncbi:MAG: omptin family outer membrane protease [Kiritimatiellaeota bacterium]|nr:omptin family outer membrane protease [Kiritimatiellota bacterium]
MNDRRLPLIAIGLLVCVGNTRAMHAGAGLSVASNESVSVSVQGQIGLLNGTAQELFYSYMSGPRQLLSELDWDIRNVTMAGATVSVNFQDSVCLNAGFWSAASSGNGQVNDWDWLLDRPGAPWTDWSVSSVDVTRAWLLDLNASIELTRLGPWALRGMAGYKYNTWRFEGHRLQHIYSSQPAVSGGFRNEIGDAASGDDVNYEQKFHIPYLGVGLTYATGRWQLAASVLYSPYVVASDYDEHRLRKLVFEERFGGGQYVGVGVHAACALPYGFLATLALDGQLIPEIRGDQTMTSTLTGQTQTTSGTAGLNNQVWMCSLGLGHTF